MRPALILTALVALGACVTVPRGGDTPAPLRLTYETSRCFGACPVYSLTLDTATGAGEFVGRQFTAVAGPRRFTATRDQVAAFHDALAGARATEPGSLIVGGSRCHEIATDLPKVTLTWREGKSAPETRKIYFGCFDAANRALFADLKRAPGLLPVGTFIRR